MSQENREIAGSRVTVEERYNVENGEFEYIREPTEQELIDETGENWEEEAEEQDWGEYEDWEDEEIDAYKKDWAQYTEEEE